MPIGELGHPMREARIDNAAFADNLAVLASAGLVVSPDLSADAWGHGLSRPMGVSGGPSADFTLTEAAFGCGEHSLRLPLTPVMRVSARVISVKRIAAGDAVSYGYTWRASVPTTLALVPLGYADGVARSAGNRARMLLVGRLRPIVGRVAMDVAVLDLGDDEVRLGDEAVLFGRADDGEPTLTEWAQSVDRRPLEVTAGIGPRVRRIGR